MTSLKKNPHPFHAIPALMLLSLSTISGSMIILCFGLLKLLPSKKLKIVCAKMVDRIATLWSDLNNLYIDKINKIQLHITGSADLKPDDWYLVIANHQSWLDIVILQRLFNRKIPVLKFFIKDQLKWVPFLGFSWWAMGCPFMKRYSKDYLAKHPHKKGDDLKATQKALTLFKETPGSLMSFIEGTRYTPQKKLDQQSPYQHLLKPKSGGIGFVIEVMGEHIKQLIDVTIVYPHPEHSLWDFLCRRVRSVNVHLRHIPIPPEFLNQSLMNDENILEQFRHWLNEQWAEKDRLISGLNTNH